METWEIVNKEFECQHSNQQIRYRIDNSSRRYYVKQCLNCGKATTSAIKLPLSTRPDDLVQFDQDLIDDYQQKRKDRLNQLNGEKWSGIQAQREIQNQQWWDRYNSYLQSSEWRRKRERVLERDMYTCQACLNRPATQVHHLTYNHVFCEPLFELISVCNQCHDLITQMDRSKRESA